MQQQIVMMVGCNFCVSVFILLLIVLLLHYISYLTYLFVVSKITQQPLNGFELNLDKGRVPAQNRAQSLFLPIQEFSSLI